MTDPLFTIISLMIGVFGATISVILVIRNVGSKKVDENYKLACDKISEMEDAGIVDINIGDAENYRDKIKHCGTWFTRYTLFAAIIFGVWVFATAFYVSFNGYCKQLSQPVSSSAANSADPFSFNKIISTILFGDWTIGIVSFAYLFLVGFALFHLQKTDANYKEVGKLHKALMAQREASPEDLKLTSKETTG